MKDKIVSILKNTPYPIRARYIAKSLGVDRTSVNKILYANMNKPFIRNDNYEWGLKDSIQQPSKEQHWATSALIREWKVLRDYVLEMYNKDQEIFNFGIVNFEMKDKPGQLVAELEVYLLHFLLDIQFQHQKNYIEEEDIQELLVLLEPSLHFNYSNHAFTQNYLKTKFVDLDNFISKLLMTIVIFDDLHETRKSYILINKIETLARYVYYANNSDDMFRENYRGTIESLKSFIDENYDYTSGETCSFEKCENCGSWVLRDSAEQDNDGNYYCFDCEYLVEEGEENRELIESEELIEEVIIESTEVEKDEILEDCTTCQFKKDKTCLKAHLNKVCKEYRYLS